MACGERSAGPRHECNVELTVAAAERHAVAAAAAAAQGSACRRRALGSLERCCSCLQVVRAVPLR